jgi:hippurate hydrolase
MAALLKALYDQAGEFVAIRRDIHANPELAFNEHRTADIVAERLGSWGYSVHRGLGGTGVVGQLKRGSGSKSVGLRADMDALPILEATQLPYASKSKGLMHACGHDGHTAMLLAGARYLAEKGEFNGTLNLIFQPAEEGAGGAAKMMADGLFEQFPCDAIFAMHNMPTMTLGHLVFRHGPTMASSDNVTITLHGKGGHGALPHFTIDPIVCASSIVMALQTIVSRNIDPNSMSVITVGAIHAGEANNVIPQTCEMRLSVRSLDPTVRETLERRIHALVNAQAESYGCRAEIDYRRGYPVLVNSKDETDFARQVGLELLGQEQVMLEGPALQGSEDFAFMLQQVPGSYLFVGNGTGEGDGGSPCMVHNPAYDFNDKNIPVGSAFWALLTQRYLV